MNNQKENHYIVIMAGGVGTRFWPASRESRPKQFLDILGVGQSLIQTTFDRASKIVPFQNIMVATNEKYKDLVLEHLPKINETNILLEPSRNNTAPCIAYAALKIKSKGNDSVFAVLPSDHVILKEALFVEKMHEAFAFAEQNEALVTLGISPTRPDTGYGYIELDGAAKEGINKVNQFKEKPDLKTAETYVNSGNYLWNAGIFIWSVNSVLSGMTKNANQIIETLSQDLDKLNTPEEQEYINQVYPLTDNISVDYALMENSNNIYTIPADIAWSDLGTWNSLHAYMDKDDAENVIQGTVLLAEECSNSLIRIADDQKAVIKGLKDMIVVLDDGVLVIYPKDKEQEIKQVRNNIKDSRIL